VVRAVNSIVVSHRPDHGYQGALHNATAYGLRGNGVVSHRVMLDGFKSAKEVEGKTFADPKLQARLLERTAGLSGKEFAARLETFQTETGVRRVQLLEKLAVIEMRDAKSARHGVDDAGVPMPYKGYKGDSNHCIEIWRSDDGKWISDVISTFDAHRIVRETNEERLRDPKRAQNGKPLIMRLIVGDYVKLEHEGRERLVRLVAANQAGRMAFVEANEANADARNREGLLPYIYKMASTMKSSKARQIFVSVAGEVRDPGFRA
jgi:CRISPR-associated endonuclease Csn1